MQTSEQIKTSLVANLNDLRMQGICLYINELIVRNDPEPTVPRFRIIDTNTGLSIKTIDEFKAVIVGTHIKQIAQFYGERLSNDRVMGYSVVPTNLVLRFNIHSKEDMRFSDQQNYFSDYMSSYNFLFSMAYMNDGDEIVPVKVSSVRIIRIV